MLRFRPGAFHFARHPPISRVSQRDDAVLAFDPCHALQPRNWLSLFDRATVLNGRDYAQRGKVLSLDEQWHDGALMLNARVSGSVATPYRTTVAVFDAGSGRFEFDSICSCPIGEHCKHAAALLFEAAEAADVPDAQQALAGIEPAAVDETAWQRWLHELERVTPRSAAAARRSTTSAWRPPRA